MEECVKRLKVRNRCIPGYTPEEIDIRCEKVDRANAEMVQKTKNSAEYCVEGFKQRD